MFNNPNNLALDSSGNIYIADMVNNRIRKVTPAGMVTTFAGSGTYGSTNGFGTSATVAAPQGIAVDSSGNVYVGDSDNNMIRKITPAGSVSTFAGQTTAGS